MTTHFLALLLAFRAVPVLDSLGQRRPERRLAEAAAEWAPGALRNRMVLEVGDGAAAEAARSAYARAAAIYGGEWTTDFARFRARWSRALTDNSWPVEVAAFWRTRGGEELQSRRGLHGPRARAILQEWVRWMEATDPRVRFALADLTTRELSIPGTLGPTDLAPGDSLSLDLSRSRYDGPVRVRVEQFVRRGLSFHETRLVGPVQTWKPPVARPVWSSKPWTTPGLYRIVWEAGGFYQQALVRVGRLELFAMPTDSGMLLWSGTEASRASKLLWMDRKGRVDSLAADFTRPLHLGFPQPADSGLVAVAAGERFAVLRLRRPRPGQHERLGLTEERDRNGRPLLVPPRIQGRSGWMAASLLDRDAYEPGDWLRISGWMRRLDPYGRPDSSRGDSLEWTLEPFVGEPTRRWVKPDARGVWTDSVRVARKGRAHVSALAAGGAVYRDEFCETGTRFRVRDPEQSCLESRPVDSGFSAASDTIRLDFRRKSSTPGLAVVARGRALDWHLALADSLLVARVPSQPGLAAGASALVASPRAGGWNGWRQSLEPEPRCLENRLPFGVETVLPSVAKMGSPLPAMRVVARSGSAAKISAFLRLVPEEHAASLRPLCQMLGRGWASSEVYTADAPWEPLGLGEPDFQSYDRRREMDPFARLGLRPAIPLCIACGPWVGSWKPSTGAADLPLACGWTGSDQPCHRSGPIPGERFQIRLVETDSAGTLRGAPNWPKWPGSWRLQIWGLDAEGRLLAWERTVRVN